jgi:pyruvate/2-oxoglutarate dehydrogenase complex dihydrolipoamide acyltransferase (E2) component
VRKFARELGVPLAEVKGSGPKGRITVEDMQAFTKGVMAGAARRPQAQAAKAPAATATGGGAGLDLGPAALAEGGLHQVRPGRAQGHVAHQEDQRRQPAPQLGDDSARHQP